ncbi:MAG: lipid-A-disaccharide synthase [Betaproteobacteria bacterium]|nr:lipid-A-disaccharide synthase [Betaproteobacteria bacterium]
MTVRIAMVAGETSGDLLASHLISAIKARLPDAVFYGIGGPRMVGQGLDAWWPSETLAVMGFSDALKRYRELSGIRSALKKRLLAEPPDVFIGIDAPDFNLDLEAALKARGIPTVHYVSPSIWAWRGGRIKKIRRAVSHILALFPFEPAIYEKAGVPVTYVGHPLADQLPMSPDRNGMRERLGLSPTVPVFALLPGSRQGELRFLADTFIEAARLVREALPEARFLVPLATRETRLMFEEAIYRCNAHDLPIRLLFGHAQDAITAADGVLVASGTATLETALLKRPMVIAYKLAPFSHFLMKRMGYLPYVGLPNILAGRFVVPEFIQSDANPEKLAAALLTQYGDKEGRAAIVTEFERIHHQLRQNTAERAASAVLACLHSQPRSDGLAVA